MRVYGSVWVEACSRRMDANMQLSVLQPEDSSTNSSAVARLPSEQNVWVDTGLTGADLSCSQTSTILHEKLESGNLCSFMLTQDLQVSLFADYLFLLSCFEVQFKVLLLLTVCCFILKNVPPSFAFIPFSFVSFYRIQSLFCSKAFLQVPSSAYIYSSTIRSTLTRPFGFVFHASSSLFSFVRVCILFQKIVLFSNHKHSNVCRNSQAEVKKSVVNVSKSQCKELLRI